MTPEEFKNLKVGDKIHHPDMPEHIWTVVNNDPPGNLILLPGRHTILAARAVHPDNWVKAEDQTEEP